MRRFLFLGVLLAACGGSRPASDYTLRLAVVGVFTALAHDTSSSATTFAQDLVYEPVLRPEGNGFASKILARWERAGPRGLRALVREDRRFSDGSPVLASDVARSIRLVGLVVREEGRWLEIEPSPDGLPVDAGLLLAVVFKQTAAGEIGTGPFRLVELEERRLVVERVVSVAGRVRRVELLGFPSVRESFARALKGEVNGVVGLDDRQVELADGVPGLRIVRARGPHALAVVFNARSLGSWMRRALAEALPIDEIEELSQGKACGPPSGKWIGTPLPDGEPLDVMVMMMDGSIERAGLALRRSMGLRGGPLAHWRAGDVWSVRARYDITVDNALVWPPAIGALYWKTGAPWNRTGYSNPAYDAAVEAGDFDRAEAELKKDPPALFLCRRERIAAIDARIKNATLGSWGLLDTLPDWEVSP